MNKGALSERDICTKFITPAPRNAGWVEMLRIREEASFTKGRIIVRGTLVSRGQAKRADYHDRLPSTDCYRWRSKLGGNCFRTAGILPVELFTSLWKFRPQALVDRNSQEPRVKAVGALFA
jgi:hypothetical protein